MTKAIFLDVDGTLVDYQNRLPQSAVKAIRRARKNGHKVYICTGRSKAEIDSKLWEIGLDGMIGGNGSYVEHQGEVLQHCLITVEQCKRAVDWLQRRGLEFYLESNNGLFASRHFETRAEPVLRLYMQRKGKPQPNASVRDLMHGIVFDGELYRDDLNKISFILNSYQDYLDAKDAFPDLQVGTWGGDGEIALFGDLGVKHIDKARAIELLLARTGISPADTLAFGDAKVDIPMLKYCRIGVAMGNGGEEIKAAADYITDNAENDGLYNAFKHFGLI